MLLIKRYPNRKLYDTNHKRYITLQGVAALIRQGEDIQVIDNATGEDLTALTLTQIIFKLEKKKSGVLPREFLANLIQIGEDRLESLPSILRFPRLFLSQVDEEIKRRVHNLIAQGELIESEGKQIIEKLLSHHPLTPGQTIDEAIEREITVRRLPSRDEIKHLETQIDNLAHKLDTLIHEHQPGEE